MNRYAIGYKMQFDEDLAYDFLVSVGEAITKCGQEVVKRKVKIKIKRNKYVVYKIKVKLEYGTVLKFKHVEPISFFGKIVTVPPNMKDGMGTQLQEQLEALGLGGQIPEEKGTQIGFQVE